MNNREASTSRAKQAIAISRIPWEMAAPTCSCERPLDNTRQLKGERSGIVRWAFAGQWLVFVDEEAALSRLGFFFKPRKTKSSIIVGAPKSSREADELTLGCDIKEFVV